jgi:MYXO-CTERM domain-containing protein
MRTALAHLRPQDTFNILTFAGQTMQAFPTPRPANRSNIAQALRVVNDMQAGGGTYMADAIDAALRPVVARGRHRYVFFMTDGYVGNESEILSRSKSFVEAYEQHGVRAKVFGFGVGSSPNRYLVSGLAEVGKGLSVYASNREDPNRAVNQFFHYIDRAVLTDVRVDWGGLRASHVYPSEIPDLFASHPIVLHGRFEGAPVVPVRILAKAGDQQLEIPVQARLAETRDAPSRALGSLWARARIDELEESLLDGSIQGAQAEITRLGLAHRLVTPFTSFVAIDTSRRVGTGDPHQVVQPAERPEGVDLDKAGGRERSESAKRKVPLSESQVYIQGDSAPTAPEPAPAPTTVAPPPPPAEADGAVAEKDAGEGYGYEYSDDPLSEGGYAAGTDAALEEPPPPSAPMSEQMASAAEEESEEDYEVDSKRGCGCRLVGGAGPSGLALSLVLGVLWAVRRRRQRRASTVRPQG